MAVNWLSGSKVDHPMADLRQTRQIVAELPGDDAPRALEEIAEWLESINNTDGFKVDRRYENIDLLDAAARRHQRGLTQEYLSTSRVQKFLENRLWNAQFNYCRQLGEAYSRCIKECLSGFSGASAVAKFLPAMAARALRALALQLKWTMHRYGLAEDRIWVELSRLYRLSEEKGIADQTVVVYPGPQGESTVKREFLKALMLSASSLDGLPPVRQEVADHAVAHFADSFRLWVQPGGCTHSFDPAGPKPPARLLAGAAPAALLYFGAGDGLARLHRLMEQIVSRDAVPQELNLGGTYHKDLVIGVLKHLGQYWSDKAPARSSERRPTAARITVVPGVDQIFEVLEPVAGNALDFSQNQTAESWIIENVSNGGCGAIVPPQKVDWVKVGVLIGMKGEVSDHLGIGLIRRITRDAHQQRRVGIQVLTRVSIPVQVSKANTLSSLNFDLTTDPAILLSITPDARGEIDVVLRGAAFSGRDSLDMRLRDKSYLLVPTAIVEAGDDFCWARFKVTAQGA